MSIELLERAAKALGDLGDEVVFVGGATVVLWITDPAAPPPRPTKDAAVVELPSGARIRAVPPTFLLATKLEAYLGRGEGDLLASRDWADIVALVDGREELVGEVWKAPAVLTTYLVETLPALLGGGRVVEGIRAQLLPDAISQARAEDVVLARLREIVESGDRA